MPNEFVFIPTWPNAPEPVRRIATLCRELHPVSEDERQAFFLSCRDAAAVCGEMHHQKAWEIMKALANPRVGVIEIVSAGKAGAKNGKAAEFRYLLRDSESGAGGENGGFEL